MEKVLLKIANVDDYITTQDENELRSDRGDGCQLKLFHQVIWRIKMEIEFVFAKTLVAGLYNLFKQ